jgi:uncharacterized protein YndB with AHSA1/START domain
MGLWNSITGLFKGTPAQIEGATTAHASGAPELVITRIFDVGRHKVWEMWSKPEKLAEWWGVPPLSATKDSCSVELKVGGLWQADMVNATDGTRLPFRGTFVEIDQPRKMVFTLHDPFDANNSKQETITVIFTDHAGTTQMTMHQKGFLPAEQYSGALVKGYNAFFDRMSRYLRLHQE